MFNKRYLSETHNHHTHVNFPDKIIEQKAPTDESIRLLNEFKDEAKKDIIATLQVEDNVLNGVVVLYRNNLYTAAIDQFECHVKFKLNGKEYSYYKEMSAFKMKSDKDSSYFIRKHLIPELKAHFLSVFKNEIMKLIFSEITGESFIEDFRGGVSKEFLK